MSSDEFIIPSNENNIVKYGIVGLVAVIILGTIYCFMTKKLMFKNKKPKKVEKFQPPVVIDYNNQVETIIQDLMKELKQTISAINQGQGTMGQLIVNDSLYINLNQLLLDLDKLTLHFNQYPKDFLKP